jgi:hypothetical protein
MGDSTQADGVASFYPKRMTRQFQKAITKIENWTLADQGQGRMK